MINLDSEHFVWNDGGRAASGFVGQTSDCVIRAIAIATGLAYKEIYERFKAEAGHSPRAGMSRDIYGGYLRERGWLYCPQLCVRQFDIASLPKGVVLAQLESLEGTRNRSHLCCVIDGVIHDTWCPDEDEYLLTAYWMHPGLAAESMSPMLAPKRKISKSEEMSQAEFEKVLRRLRALDRTARNEASTDGERRNALRALQTIMLANNLTRDDLAEDDNVSGLCFGRISCYVNGIRVCRWEGLLANYVCHEVFTSVQVYTNRIGYRTRCVFYGPIADVRNAILLFRELLLTIAAFAHRRYGGFSRGSGASYCEGYVAGLPRNDSHVSHNAVDVLSTNALVQTRLIAIQTSADQWLRDECGVSLRIRGRRSRYGHDPHAANQGRLDGARHQIEKPHSIKRIEHDGSPPSH